MSLLPTGPGQVLVSDMAVSSGERWAVLPERTPDGEARVWTLYRPEPFVTDGVWLRRCDVFSTEANAKGFLNTLLGVPEGHSLPWKTHPLFPELQAVNDERGHWWYLCAAPVDPLVGRSS